MACHSNRLIITYPLQTTFSVSRMKLYSFYSLLSLFGIVWILYCCFLVLSNLDTRTIAIFCGATQGEQPAAKRDPGKKIIILAYPRYEMKTLKVFKVFIPCYLQIRVVSTGRSYFCAGEFLLFFRASPRSEK